MALIRWLPEARDLIRKGAYRGISPAIVFGAKDRESGKDVGAKLKSAGVTNSPFLDLPPITAKDSAPAPNATSKASADEIAKLRAECKRLRDEIAVLTRRCTLLESKRKEERQQRRELQAILSDREDRDLDEMVMNAKDAYQLPQDHAVLMVVAKASPEGFAAMYPRIAPHLMHLTRTIATGGREAAAVTMRDPSEEQAPKPLPTIDEQVASVVALAKSRGCELSRDESYALAHEQLRRKVRVHEIVPL